MAVAIIAPRDPDDAALAAPYDFLASQESEGGKLPIEIDLHERGDRAMPYKSKMQQRKIHVLLEQGKIAPKVVEEFDQASKGRKLPEKAPRRGKGR